MEVTAEIYLKNAEQEPDMQYEKKGLASVALPPLCISLLISTDTIL